MREREKYCKLNVYEKSYKAGLAIYRMTKTYPEEEKYGMVSQLRRASTSIPLNIAEGYAKRSSQEEFKRFLKMAIGSTNEIRVLLDYSKDLGYIEEEQYNKASDEYDEIGRMLSTLIKRVEQGQQNKGIE